MNTKKAIDILAKHQEKLFALPASPQKFSSWKVQALTFIETFFKEGRNSNEYRALKNYESLPRYDGDSAIADNAKPALSSFIGDCIQTINSIGVYNPPKKNFLYTVDNRWLAAIVVSGLTGMYFLGHNIGKRSADVQLFELRQEIKDLKKSSNGAISPTLIISNDKTNDTTNRNKKDSTP